MGALDFLRRVVVGVPPLVGDVLPARQPPRVPAWDGRTAALRALRGYVCQGLEFYRPGDDPKSQVIPFRVLEKNFHVDYPDSESAIDFAAGTCAVVPSGRFTYEPTGLTTFFDEQSWNVHGQGTVLQVMSTYVERFSLEYRCQLVQQRRAWKGGMEVAFSPAEGVAVLRLKTSGYYGTAAAFALMDGMLLDSEDEARGRRAVQLGVELRVQVVRLVNAATLVPVPVLTVDVDETTGDPVVTTVNLPPGS